MFYQPQKQNSFDRYYDVDKLGQPKFISFAQYQQMFNCGSAVIWLLIILKRINVRWFDGKPYITNESINVMMERGEA